MYTANNSSLVVCFDLGGVIVKICRSWPEACESAGLPIRDEQRLLSSGWQKRQQAVVAQHQSGQMERSAYFDAISKALGGLYSPPEIEQIHTAWTQREYAGVGALVDELNALPNVLTACLSNTNAAHWQRLSGADGRNEYPTVAKLKLQLASHLLGLVKPDSEIYDHATTVFNQHASGPQPLIVFFDDLAENVDAARSAGWSALQIDHTGDTSAQMRQFLKQEHQLQPANSRKP